MTCHSEKPDRQPETVTVRCWNCGSKFEQTLQRLLDLKNEVDLKSDTDKILEFITGNTCRLLCIKCDPEALEVPPIKLTEKGEMAARPKGGEEAESPKSSRR